MLIKIADPKEEEAKEIREDLKERKVVFESPRQIKARIYGNK